MHKVTQIILNNEQRFTSGGDFKVICGFIDL